MAPPQATTPPHRLDVKRYERIVASGALEGERVELLRGAIVGMSPQSPAHAAIVEALTRHFSDAPCRLRVQMPLAVAPDSEPEPDLALVDEPAAHGRHPRSAALVVEVAVASHATDRGLKARLYASAGIPVYWLVDVPGRCVEVRTEPRADGYAAVRLHHRGEPISCPVSGVADLDLAALLHAEG